jgi:hypothetical protein
MPTGALDAIGLQTRGAYGQFNKSEACAHLKSGCPSRGRLCPPRRKATP